VPVLLVLSGAELPTSAVCLSFAFAAALVLVGISGHQIYMYVIQGMSVLRIASRVTRGLGSKAWGLPFGAVPVIIFIWKSLKLLRRFRDDSQTGSDVEEEPLEDILLPPTERLWEMYDEDAVEGLHAASEDPMLMAALMRE
jgi:hypothetical protein